jgi:DNA-binding Xre family transcriptional regulator
MNKVILVDKIALKARMLERRIEFYGDLAELAGVSRPAIVNMIHHGNVRTKKIEQVAAALDCDPLDLIITVDPSTLKRNQKKNGSS